MSHKRKPMHWCEKLSRRETGRATWTRRTRCGQIIPVHTHVLNSNACTARNTRSSGIGTAWVDGQGGAHGRRLKRQTPWLAAVIWPALSANTCSQHTVVPASCYFFSANSFLCLLSSFWEFQLIPSNFSSFFWKKKIGPRDLKVIYPKRRYVRPYYCPLYTCICLHFFMAGSHITCVTWLKYGYQGSSTNCY